MDTPGLLMADWTEALFVHFRMRPQDLRDRVPLSLDLYDGWAYVSFVAFTQRELRLNFGGRIGRWLAAPLAEHEFLNLRTYVRHGGVRGIFFLSEWIPNRLAVFLGPRMYGLPYRLGRLEYHTDSAGEAHRRVDCAAGQWDCAAHWNPAELAQCEPESESEFLLERYTAFTFDRGILRRFDVGHEPWQAAAAKITLKRNDLTSGMIPAGDYWAHYSPGVSAVRIGWPRLITTDTFLPAGGTS